MKAYVWLGVVLMGVLTIVQGQRICTDCYSDDSQKQPKFLCHHRNCDQFYWPRHASLPQNIQCKTNSHGQMEGNCFLLSGLDTTKNFFRFITYKKESNQQHKKIEFSFEDRQQQLVIYADVQNSKYEGKVMSHPDISFDDVKQALNTRLYKVVKHSSELLKIKVGFYMLEMKNTLITTVAELKSSMTHLSSELKRQTDKNIQLQRVNYDLKLQLNLLAQKISTISYKVTAFEKFTADYNKYDSKKLNELDTSSKTIKKQAQSAAKQSKSTLLKLNQLERDNLELKKRLKSIQTTQDQLNSTLAQYNSTLETTNQKTYKLQQKLITFDQTTTHLRQQIGTVDKRFVNLNQAIKEERNFVNKFSQKIQQLAGNCNANNSTFDPNDILLPTLTNLDQSKSADTPEQVAKQYPFQTFYEHSKVVTEPQEVETLKSFFGTKKVATVELLYRASENQFSVSKFHKSCDKVASTLVVTTNEYGKKMGGFTGLLWDGTKSGEYRTDNTGESFIFSLTNGDKFLLTDKSTAIWNHANYGPAFGSGADLLICNQADKKPLSYADINKSYQNGQYQQRDRSSWERFSGNPNNSWHYRVQEWEVWRVVFEQELAAVNLTPTV